MKYSMAGSGNVFWEEKGEVCVCVLGGGGGGGVANRTYILIKVEVSSEQKQWYLLHQVSHKSEGEKKRVHA